MDFVTDLLLSADWKSDSYNLILVIVDQLTKIVYYKPSKVTINASWLADVIINVVMQYHGLLHSIMSDWEAIFTFKFWFSLCYFFGIKQQLSTAFYS